MSANEEMKVDLDAITNMAKRLGLKGDDITKYVHEHMTKLGYKSRRSYYREEKSSGSGGFSFFSSGRNDDDGDDL